MDPGRVDGVAPRPGPVDAGRVRAEAAALARDAASPWVAAQAGALTVPASLPWAERVRRCLLVEPVLGPVDVLAAAHDELRALLPGTGELRARLSATRRLVPVARLRETAERAVALLDPAADVDLALVDGPVGAGLQTRPGTRPRLLLAARPVSRSGLLALVAHELAHVAEQRALRGRPEREAAVLATPEAVLSEGLAETALRARPASVEALGGTAEEQAVTAVARPLAARARADAVVLLHTRGPEAAAGHLARWGLLEPERVTAAVRFAGDPRWAVHAAAYGAGARLVGGLLDAAGGAAGGGGGGAGGAGGGAGGGGAGGGSAGATGPGAVWAGLLGRDLLPADLLPADLLPADPRP